MVRCKKALQFAEQSARDSSADTRAALKISDRIASATEIGAQSAYGSVGLQRRNVEIMRDGLSLQQKRVQAEAAGKITLEITDIEPFIPGVVGTATLKISNAGSSEIQNAWIQANMSLGRDKDVPDAWATFEKYERGDFVTLGPGQTVTHSYKIEEVESEDFDWFMKSKDLYYILLGKVEYVDKAGVRHKRYICSLSKGKGVNISCPTPGQT